MASTMVGSSCSSTRACRQGSIFLTMMFEPSGSAVDALEVDVTLDDGVAQMALPIPRPVKGFASSESFEIDLSSYQRYTNVAIIVIARDGVGDEIGRGVDQAGLTPGCLATTIVIRSPSGAGGAGGGGIGGGGLGGGGAGGSGLGGTSGGGTSALGGASSIGGAGGIGGSGGIAGGSGGIAGGSGGIVASSGGIVGGGGASNVGGKGGGTATGGNGGTSTCTANGTGVVALLGCPCSAPGSLACNGNAQAVTLICSAGTWMHNQTCMAGNLCDSRMGVSAGTCQPIVPACRNATPGQLVCDPSTSVAQCGPDLVSDSVQETCTGATPACLNHACVACMPTSTKACGVCNDGIATCDSVGAWGPCVGASSKTTYYRDADGDSFGDPKTAMTVCGAAPTGYVSNSKDCCDADANAHPGQTSFFTVADACGSNQVPDGFDYDCDGVDTTKAAVQNASCVSTLMPGDCGCPMCYCNSTNGGAPVCGLTSCFGYNVTACGTSYTEMAVGFSTMTCMAGGGGGIVGLQGCR
jgi:hypothetical protein